MKRKFDVFSGIALKWLGESFVTFNGKKMIDLPGLLSHGFESDSAKKEEVLNDCKAMLNEFKAHVEKVYPEVKEKTSDVNSPSTLFKAWIDAWENQFNAYETKSNYHDYRKACSKGFINYWDNYVKPYHEFHQIKLK